MPSQPSRRNLRGTALDWLHELGIEVGQASELRGDVSLRRYVRVALDRRSAIVAIYPPQMRDAYDAFVQTTDLLSAAGVRTPEVKICSRDRGLMLIEDVGDQTLYDLEGADPALISAYFHQAASDIERIGGIPVSEVGGLNPPLDAELLHRELEQTRRTLFEPLVEVASLSFYRQLDKLFDTLCDQLDRGPRITCHRDFMARNLVPIEPRPTLVVLDHQDLRAGPRHYDLASLLNDSLFPTRDLEEAILDRLVGNQSDERIHYHRAAAQRTLKATGTYLMFAERGFRRHRKLVPGTLRRALHHLERLPEAESLYEQLAEVLEPRLRRGDEP